MKSKNGHPSHLEMVTNETRLARKPEHRRSTRMRFPQLGVVWARLQKRFVQTSPRVGPMAQGSPKLAMLGGANLFLALCTVLPAQTQAAKTPYPAMAPIDQYLMTDRSAEISLAQSAAPESISRDATVLVLGKQGYETAIVGKNGFTCLVERSWMSPFDSPDFWNPKLRGPVCYNPPAVLSILPYTIYRTKLVLAGLSKAQMKESIKGAVAKRELRIPQPGAMSYMMAKDGYLGDSVGHWHPHLMFHIPKTDGASWGANLPGSPVLLDDDHLDIPEPQTVFLVPVGRWSDGTPAHKEM
jgi:hypothetical protein